MSFAVRNPASISATLTDHAPRSMPRMLCAILVLSPVDPRALPVVHVARRRVLIEVRRVPDGAHVHLDLLFARALNGAGGVEPIDAPRPDGDHVVHFGGIERNAD